MNLEKLKDSARKFEQKEDWRRAIEVYLKALQQIESGAETTPDLSLYNRIGDLYLKINDTASAVRSYERAVDLYADQGFFNNAIALCGKILRVNPGRTQTYLKLAQLHARKNVVIEAKRNLIEFLERMNALGQLEQAFTSIKEFADRFSGSQEIRLMLVELLRAASREDEAQEQLEKIVGAPPSAPPSVGGARPAASAEPSGAPATDHSARRGDLVFLDTGFAPAARSQAEAEQPTPLEGLESSTRAEPPSEEEPASELGLPEALVADLSAIEISPTALPTLGEAEGGELETIDGAGELQIADLGIEPAEASELDFVVPLDGVEPTSVESDEIPPVEISLDADRSDEPAGMLDFIAVESEPSEQAAADEAQETSVADLELQVLDDPADPDRHRDLAVALVQSGDVERAVEELTHSLSGYESREDWPTAARVADRLVALAPDDIRHHQKRVELAYRMGDRSPLVEAYLALADALDRLGAGDKAVAVYARVQEHEPGNVRAGEALARLSAAPPAPAPPRVRTIPQPAAPEPAAPEPAAPEPAAPEPAASEPAAAAMPPEAVAPPAPAREPTARASVDEFIDLGAMVIEEGPRDTRMRIERSEPAHDDEQREFAEILEQFKRGIEENLENEDYQAHYDLGVAFKEMGLLDEAIAEFQKALRAPEASARLRTSEALGAAFFDKAQYAVSESVLRRAVSSLDGGDDTKIGVIYWLGRAEEAQGKTANAIASYERAMAVDIRFMDLGERLQRLTAGRQA